MVNVSTNTKGNVNISATPANNVTANSKNNQDVNANTNNDYLLSKSWAVGKGLIQNEDYSSKHYAQQAKASEEIASSAIQNIDDIANQAIEDIETTQNEALENLETAKDEKITEINNTASDFEDDLTALTERAETAANSANVSAAAASSDASSAHLYAVDANESKTSAITSATTATNAKNDAQTAAISANSSAADAQNANIQAQTSATTASNAATSAANSANQAISAKDTAYDYAQQAQTAKTQIEQSLINYYTKSETYSKTEVQALIASIPQFSVEVVQSLPATGERMVLYLVPKDGETPDVCNEYIWVENENRYELIGNTAIDLTNYVTTDTAQDISGRKTFLGEKAIYFKQQATSNKLGFTLYNPSNTELAALEYRPNTIGGASLLALNCPQTTGGYVGFRYWGTPAVNIVAPKVATAGNYYMTTHITNGSTTVTANNQGTVNINTLLPDVSGFATQTWVQNQNYITSAALTDYVTNTSLATTLADYVTNSALTTTLADYALSADIPTKTSDLTNDSNFATVSQIPTNNNQLTNGAGYITNSALTPYVLSSSLATVATTGSYDDLTDKPYIPSGVVVDQTYDATSQNAQSGVAIAGAGFLTGITSGDVTTALGYTPYNSSNPSGYQANKIETIKVNGTAQIITSKAVDITVPTNNNQLTNGAGYITSSALNGYAKTADLATVATSGSYNDLTNKPTIPAAQVNADWNATSGLAQILNKPTIPTVGNGTVTINQGGVQKGTFTLNQSGNATIDLDAGGTVDQTFGGTSQNAQSGVAIQGELSTNYQSKLVSGTNIKTINNTSLLGNGNIDTSEIFVAKYNVTTFQQVSNAYSTGKTIVCDLSPFRCLTITYDPTLRQFVFSGVSINNLSDTGILLYYIILNSSDNWSIVQKQLADTDLSNLSTTGQAVIDGQWVKSHKNVLNNATLNNSSGQEYTITNYFPDSTYKYEIIIEASWAGSNSGIPALRAYTSEFEDASCWLGRCNANGFGAGSGLLVVGTDHKIWLITGGSGVKNAYCNIKAYRRIGTNS